MKTKILFCVLIMMLCLPAMARDYYVKPSGDDGNAGTAAKPFATIQKAADLAKAGDTIFIGEGVYYEGVTIKNDGAPGKWIVFRNIEGETPILDGKFEMGIGMDYSHRSHIEIDGLTLRHFKYVGAGNRSPGAIVVRNCVCYRNGSAGICMNYGRPGSRLLVEDNVCYENGWGVAWASGIHINNKDQGKDTFHIIRRNICYNNYDNSEHRTDGNGIMFDLGGVGSYCLIENNLCFNNGAGGINVLGGRADVVNNTLYRNGWDKGLLTWKGEPRYAAELMISGWKDHTKEYSKKTTVRNNIIWTRGYYPSGLENDMDCVFENNLFWSDKDPSTIKLPEWVKDSVIADPQFVNAPKVEDTFDFRGAKFLKMDVDPYDFRLKADSPAIDAGVQVKLLEDIHQTIRPLGIMFDIGAFECN
ncbi:DUF1565 domain-containing protein [bacterium]|nr:DUF1565 domain-containing protein [bacterium]